MWPLRRLCSARNAGNVARRTFLSSAYSCEEAWDKARNSRLIAKLHLDELYSRACAQAGPPTTVDVDLLALGAARSGTHLSEMRDLLCRHRSSSRGADLPESTSYSAVRAYMDCGETSELLQVLDDRVNHGVFLSDYTANMLLNKFIVGGDLEAAARVASFLMLQEDFGGPISQRFAFLAAYRYLSTVDLSEPPPPPPEEKPLKKKKIEEIKIRVGFLRNPYFDDHFDLRDPVLLVGKTLALASVFPGSDRPLDANCRLLGWTFYKKFDKATAVAQSLADADSAFDDTVGLVTKILQNCNDPKRAEENQQLNSILSILKSSKTQAVNIDSAISDSVKEAVEKHEKEEIEGHNRIFAMWESNREAKLKEQIERFENARREKAIQDRETELKKLDDRLWFFDNQGKVNLMIQNRNVYYPKRWWGRIRKPKDVVKNYIPPEV